MGLLECCKRSEVQRSVNNQQKHDMKLFGFYNKCYWMIISSIQELENEIENILASESSFDFMRKEIAAGRCVFVNQAGGWHTGEFEDKRHEMVASEKFPTIYDAIRIVDARLEVLKDYYCEKKGVTREELEKLL
jgi:myo-inositol catabolism protein IolC